MFITIIWTQVLTVAGVALLFIVISYLNARIKPKRPVEMPEKCRFCPSKTCLVKTSEIDKKQEELEQYLKSCEESNETN